MAVGEHSKHFHHLRVFLVYVLLVFLFIYLFIFHMRHLQWTVVVVVDVFPVSRCKEEISFWTFHLLYYEFVVTLGVFVCVANGVMCVVPATF